MPRPALGMFIGGKTVVETSQSMDLKVDNEREEEKGGKEEEEGNKKKEEDGWDARETNNPI